MARGQSQAADTQLGKTNAIGEQQLGKATALENKLLPQYSTLSDSGYFSPEEAAAATTSATGATAAPFESAKFEAANRAARTNNASDLTAQQDDLAMKQGQAQGQTAEALQAQKMNNQLSGMYGIGQLQAENQATANSMYGLGPSTLQARAAGQNTDLELAKAGIGAAGAAAS